MEQKTCKCNNRARYYDQLSQKGNSVVEIEITFTLIEWEIIAI